MPNHKTSDA